jgi:hypothetical protein
MYSNNRVCQTGRPAHAYWIPAVEPQPDPELGWSLKRQRALDSCARLYYHLVYGAWNGWRASPGERSWHTYRLKHLVTPEQVVGIEVHERAREVVRAIRNRTPVPTREVLYARSWDALGRLREADLRAFLRDPKRHPVLVGVYYGAEGDWDAAVRSAAARLDACIGALLDSHVLTEIARCDPREILLPEPFDRVAFAVDGSRVPLWAAPDLVHWRTAAPGERRTLEITDWKTGRPDGAEAQLAAYAVFLRARWGIAFAEGRFAGRAVCLSDGGVEDRRVLTRTDLVSAAARIADGVRTMRRFLASPEGAAPLPPGAFPMLPDDDPRCARCAFRQLCDADRASGPAHPAGEDCP